MGNETEVKIGIPALLEGAKIWIGVVLFAVGITVTVCAWLNNQTSTLRQIQAQQQEIKNSQERHYKTECRWWESLRQYDSRTSLWEKWVDKQLSSGSAPDLPENPDGPYCDEDQSPDPALQNRNLSRPSLRTPVPDSVAEGVAR